MLNIKEVQGTMEIVKELEFNIDTIYVRSNIKKIETDKFVGWQYDETQYTYQEWLELKEEDTIKINNLTNSQKEQDSLLVDNAYRIAMLELSTNNII